LEIPIEIKDNLFDADFGKSLNFLLHKRPSNEYNSNPLKKESLRKCPKSNSYVEHLEKLISSEPIEGEPSHLEAIPIFSPSMPTLDVLSESILDPNDPYYALSPKSHDVLEIHQDNQSIGIMRIQGRPRRATTTTRAFMCRCK
jgi:hypothetical protein